MNDELFIKMCDCPEIQEQKQYKSGDIYYEQGYEPEVLGDFIRMSNHQATRGGYDYDFYELRWEELVWLPRQDDLQAMVEESHILKLSRLVDWLCNEDWDGGFYNDYAESFTSMEQLWLAFVLKERYSKIWNGTGWLSC